MAVLVTAIRSRFGAREVDSALDARNECGHDGKWFMGANPSVIAVLVTAVHPVAGARELIAHWMPATGAGMTEFARRELRSDDEAYRSALNSSVRRLILEAAPPSTHRS